MIFEVSYGYDAVGNPLYREDLVDSTKSELYGHDARDRLRSFGRGTLSGGKNSITTTLVDAALSGAQAWSGLDRRGNWLEWSNTTNNVTVEQARTVNGINEYLTLDRDGSGTTYSPQSLTHDANGNLTEDPTAWNAGDTTAPSGQGYNYDEENRLRSVLRAGDSQMLLEISYDAFGRRIETVEYVDPATGDQLSGEKVTRHIMLGAETIEEYDLTDGGETCTLARQFVWGPEFPEPVGLIDYTDAGAVSAGTAEYFHYLRDRLHSVMAVTDNSGALVEHYRYDAYGRTHIYDDSNTLLASSAIGSPFAWTGQRYDAITRLYHFLYRGYSPPLGRWLQRDPVGYDRQSANLYAYVDSAPKNRIDPLGLFSVECAITGGIGGAITGGALGSGPFSVPGAIVGAVVGAIVNGHEPGDAAALAGVLGDAAGKVGDAADNFADAFLNSEGGNLIGFHGDSDPEDEKALDDGLTELLRRMVQGDRDDDEE